jgi:hypothetical protein
VLVPQVEHDRNHPGFPHWSQRTLAHAVAEMDPGICIEKAREHDADVELEEPNLMHRLASKRHLQAAEAELAEDPWE